MLSFTERRNTFGDLSGDSSSANLAIGDKNMNIIEKKILSSYAWPFLDKQFTTVTDSSNQFIILPQYIDRVSSVTVTVGTYTYSPRECQSREMWDRLNMTTVTSNIPTWWFVYDGKLGLFPKPSTSSNTVTINGKQLAKDLSITDYSTGTIATTVVGSATVTGGGTSWAASMAGRWLRITESDTTNKGDGFWYQILSVASTTSLTLVRPYVGTAITAGSAAYTISQCSLMPEQYQDLPMYWALWMHFLLPNPEKAQLYKQLYTDGCTEMKTDYSVRNQSCVLDDGDGRPIMDSPNLFLTL